MPNAATNFLSPFYCTHSQISFRPAWPPVCAQLFIVVRVYADQAVAEGQAHGLERAVERQEIKEFLDTSSKDIHDEGAKAEEIEEAESSWTTAVEYDTVKALTRLQSRLESLNTKGIFIKQASRAETSALVAKVKVYEAAKKAKAEDKAAAMELESLARRICESVHLTVWLSAPSFFPILVCCLDLSI